MDCETRFKKPIHKMRKNTTVIWDTYQEIMNEKGQKKMAKKSTSKYDSYTEETQQFMVSTEAFLRKKFGKIGKRNCNCWPPTTIFSYRPRIR